MRPPTLTGIHVPNRLKSRSSRHPADEHGLFMLIYDLLKTRGHLHTRHRSLSKSRACTQARHKPHCEFCVAFCKRPCRPNSSPGWGHTRLLSEDVRTCRQWKVIMIYLLMVRVGGCHQRTATVTETIKATTESIWLICILMELLVASL